MRKQFRYRSANAIKHCASAFSTKRRNYSVQQQLSSGPVDTRIHPQQQYLPASNNNKDNNDNNNSNATISISTTAATTISTGSTTVVTAAITNSKFQQHQEQQSLKSTTQTNQHLFNTGKEMKKLRSFVVVACPVRLTFQVLLTLDFLSLSFSGLAISFLFSVDMWT